MKTEKLREKISLESIKNGKKACAEAYVKGKDASKGFVRSNVYAVLVALSSMIALCVFLLFFVDSSHPSIVMPGEGREDVDNGKRTTIMQQMNLSTADPTVKSEEERARAEELLKKEEEERMKAELEAAEELVSGEEIISNSTSTPAATETVPTSSTSSIDATSTDVTPTE